MRFLATGGVLKDFLSADVTDAEMINTTELGEAPEVVVDEEKPALLFGWKTNIKRYKKLPG
jgi:hypothetical protein